MNQRRAFGWQWLDDGGPWLVVLLTALALLLASRALRPNASPRPLRSPARAAPLAPQVRPSPNAERDPICRGVVMPRSSGAKFARHAGLTRGIEAAVPADETMGATPLVFTV
jgi:hypothetical protein